MHLENGQALNDITNREASVDLNNENTMDAAENIGENRQQEKHDGIDPGLLKLTHERYTSMAETLIIYLREQEERNEDREDWEGVRTSQLVEWSSP
jgi:hypothetical protein